MWIIIHYHNTLYMYMQCTLHVMPTSNIIKRHLWAHQSLYMYATTGLDKLGVALTMPMFTPVSVCDY